MPGSRAAAIGVLVVLAVAGLERVWSVARASAGIDFYQMWLGPRFAGERDFYSVETRTRIGGEYARRARIDEQSPRRVAVADYRRNLETLSTPLLYTLYAPLRGGYERDLLIFHALVLAALVGWVALLARTFGLNAVVALALFSLLTLAFEPVRSDARVANMNHLMLLLLAIAAALTAKRMLFLAGAVLALAALTKPYVVAVLPLTWAFCILRGRWRDLGAHTAGAAVAGAAGIAVSSAFFGSPTIWLDWLRAFRAMPREMTPIDAGNFSLSRIVFEFTGSDISIALIVLFIAVAIVAAARGRASPPDIDLLAIGLGCAALQLASPLLWVHHLLLAVPLIAFLLRPVFDGEDARPRHAAAVVALGLLTIEPWATLVSTVTQVALLANAGLLIAFAAGLRELRVAR